MITKKFSIFIALLPGAVPLLEIYVTMNFKEVQQVVIKEGNTSVSIHCIVFRKYKPPPALLPINLSAASCKNCSNNNTSHALSSYIP